MISILQTIDTCNKLLNIKTQIHQLPWRYYKEIPSSARGIYILEDDEQRPIYVGKGWIRNRQDTHWPKAHGQTKSYQTDPKGWKQLREHNTNMNPKEWAIYYTELTSETALTALEGALIHLLQPLANDETFKDTNHTAIGAVRAP